MMSAVATPEREVLEGQRPVAAHDATRLFDAGPTLEDRVVVLWDELTVSGHAVCPVCGGSLRAAGGCEGCGSELS